MIISQYTFICKIYSPFKIIFETQFFRTAPRNSWGLAVAHADSAKSDFFCLVKLWILACTHINRSYYFATLIYWIDSKIPQDLLKNLGNGKRKIWEKVNLGGFRFHFTTDCGGRRISSLLLKTFKFKNTVCKKNLINLTEMINNFSFEDMVSFDYNTPLDVSGHFGTFIFFYLIKISKVSKIFKAKTKCSTL